MDIDDVVEDYMPNDDEEEPVDEDEKEDNAYYMDSIMDDRKRFISWNEDRQHVDADIVYDANTKHIPLHIEFTDMGYKYTTKDVPHPVYMKMRYATSVHWEDEIYPNIEYALSTYRTQIEMNEHILNSYTMRLFYDHPRTYNSNDIIPHATHHRYDLFGDRQPSSKVCLALDKRFMQLVAQVYMQHGAFYREITLIFEELSANRHICIRSYDYTQKLACPILETLHGQF